MKPGVHYFGIGPRPSTITNLIKVVVAESGAIDCYALNGKNNWEYNTRVMKYLLDGEAELLTASEAEKAFKTISRTKKWVP